MGNYHWSNWSWEGWDGEEPDMENEELEQRVSEIEEYFNRRDWEETLYWIENLPEKRD